MASKSYYFTGEFKWAKFQKPDPKFNIYTCDFYPDKESWDMFKDSGLQLKVRKDEDGNEFIKLRRNVDKKVKGGLVEIGPPEVKLLTGLDDDGKEVWEQFDKLIGNGSKGVAKVRVYDTDRGKGHELVLVAIRELVSYEESVGGDDYPF